MSSLTATMESSTWGTSSSKWTASDRREQVPDLSTDGMYIIKVTSNIVDSGKNLLLTSV